MPKTGSRFKEEDSPKLNIKKVVIVLLIPIIIFGCYKLFGMYQKQSKEFSIKRINSIGYFTSYENGKWGVINSKGEVVIQNKYDEMITIPDKQKPVFITTEVEDKEKKVYKTKVINNNESEIFKDLKEVKPIEYDSKDQTYDKNLLTFKKGNKYGLADFEGTVKFEAKFDEIKPMKNIVGKVLVKQDGKVGVVNTNTVNYTVSTIYKSVEPIWDNSETSYKVVFENKQGVFSAGGVQVLKTEYDSIEKVKSNDYVVATKSGVKEVYDLTGKRVASAPNGIEQITKKGIMIISKNSKYGIQNFNGKEILPYKYEEIRPAGKNNYIVKENGKYNIVSSDSEGNTDIEDRTKKKLTKDYDTLIYKTISETYIAKLDSKEYVLDADLNIKLSDVNVLDMTKDYMLVKELTGSKEEKLYNYKFVEIAEDLAFKNNNLIRFKENNKYGFKNKEGQVIVTPIYDDAKYQNEYGFVAVNRNGKWGSLNYKGEVVQKLDKDLNDYLSIDFIGNWYKDKDPELFTYIK